jgi:hypothetical protein
MSNTRVPIHHPTKNAGEREWPFRHYTCEFTISGGQIMAIWVAARHTVLLVYIVVQKPVVAHNLVVVVQVVPRHVLL